MKASKNIFDGESVDEVDEEAASWLARLDAAGLLSTSADVEDLTEAQPEFGDWVSASFARRTAFLRLLAAWRRADRLSAFPERDAGRTTWIRPRLAIAASLAICTAAALLGFAVLRGPVGASDVQFAEASHRYQTGVGSRETVPLSDGSIMELNTDTVVVADVDADGRFVELQQGEAYFEIADDPSRPFVIRAGEETVTVLGTKFSVQRLESGIEVMVTEGRVQIEEAASKAQPTFVSVGQKATTESGSVLVEDRDVATSARDMSWRTGRLEFRDAPLSTVAAEFNRYNSVQLVVVGDNASDIPIGGSFKATNVDAFGRLLRDGLGLEVEWDDTEIRVSAP